MVISKTLASQAPALELPKTTKFEYRRGDFKYRGKRLNWSNDQYNGKYTIEVFCGKEYIGRFTFFTKNTIYPEIVFAGIWIEPPFRGHGFSKAFLGEIDYIADLAAREFSEAHPQNKPLMCRSLHSAGFDPIVEHTRENLNRVFVLDAGNNGQVSVYFPHPPAARNFRNSKIARNAGYQVLEAEPDTRKALECVLKVPYIRLRPGLL